MKIKLPTKKELGGQRLGQMIYSILYEDFWTKKGKDMLDKLFYIENADLEKKINNYLKKVVK